jgi:hypothetical protein
MKVIINADDFGFSESVNLGIIEGHKNGIVTSTTIMVNMPAVEHALNLLKQNSSLGLGIHISLTVGKPISSNVNTLIKETGEFYGIAEIQNFANLEDVYKEAKAQIEKLIFNGIYPTHLDSHHHVHTLKNFRYTFFELAKEYNLPIRIINEEHKEEARRFGIRTVDRFSDNFYDSAEGEILIQKLRELPADSVIEIMTHPGFMDEDTIKRTSYNYKRELELKELIRLKSSKTLKNMKLQFISFDQLRKQ